jgi:hypothetical protein
MTVEILSETEAEPASRPAMPADLFDKVQSESGGSLSLGMDLARQVPPEFIWPRLEAWMAWRWGARQVVWVVEGPGEWAPRLKPATLTATEIWRCGAWANVTLAAAPSGYCLEAETYRLTATVGADETPPPAVQEAFRRLARFMASQWDDPGGITRTEDGSGYSAEQPAGWAARGIHYSGAADLLRGYRT